MTISVLVIKESRIYNSVDGVDVILSRLFAHGSDDPRFHFTLLTNSNSKGPCLSSGSCRILTIPYPSSGIYLFFRYFFGFVEAIFSIYKLHPSIIVITQPYHILMALPYFL